MPLPVTDTPTAYSNKTLVHNWWEDRFVPNDTKLNTTERVFARDLGASTSGSDLQTTKRVMETTVLSTPAPAPPRKPSMYSGKNLEERLQTYGTPAKVHYPLGDTLGTAQDAQRFLETTNQHFFDKLPEMATTSRPGYYTSPDRTHFKQGTIGKVQSDDSVATTTVGGKGARGEITRNPKESGNVYGVSVFVDEYAKWQTHLSGVPLNETVKRMQTKYF
mmetsp:Transcript_37553/g.83620  ORF Transcript_37553/g.83620 Transcript_37553/m.83620 type:complete len:219 (-) Transcript_37553:362-1018(-)|eukprot:CAMPEP_0202901552 /NCGR_PEP_ID=MMETSP1392-20130828/14322_1 /ASSEMBLY_ACC=CAM_ASM_000868 /TAXON_ID=225041 /ORGANISM="Chlamydomonas chlamydogama, Strain SAG 11-48b" /LENGTH=218 /DNA_ID=CAMNT_0049588133 /DNA_START=213 /DNA_END=869 /DNA_ORIENTATION=+